MEATPRTFAAAWGQALATGHIFKDLLLAAGLTPPAKRLADLRFPADPEELMQRHGAPEQAATLRGVLFRECRGLRTPRCRPAECASTLAGGGYATRLRSGLTAVGDVKKLLPPAGRSP